MASLTSGIKHIQRVYLCIYQSSSLNITTMAISVCRENIFGHILPFAFSMENKIIYIL